MQAVMAAFLAERGYEVVAVGDGLRAWELHQEEPFSLLIVDWMLPGLDGIELCRRVRALPDGDASVILLMTARGQASDLAQVLEAGANDYIAKPFELGLFDVRLTIAEWQVAQIAERERQRRRRDGLLRAARRLAAEAESAALLGGVLAEAVALLDGDDGSAMRWDEARGCLVTVRRHRSTGEAAWRIAVDEDVGNRALQRRQAVILNDPEVLGAATTPPGRSERRAALAAPMLYEGRVLGTLVVHSSDQDRQFSDDDGALLELLASLAAAALTGLERARLEGALLAARTAQHELANQLALTVGHTELISINPALPPNLRDAVNEAIRGAEQAIITLRRLQHITRLEETDWGPQTKPTIDLRRSTGEDER